jgi:hypothetical protein
MNQGSGFCAPSWPPATELDTPRIGQVAVIAEWLTKLLEDVVVRTHLMSLLFLEEVDPSSGRPLKL